MYNMDILGGQSRACTVSSNIFWHLKSLFLAVGQIPKYVPHSCLQWDKLPGVKLCWGDLQVRLWLGGWDTCIFSLPWKKNPHEMCLVMRVVWVLLYPKILGKKKRETSHQTLLHTRLWEWAWALIKPAVAPGLRVAEQKARVGCEGCSEREQLQSGSESKYHALELRRARK